jgi:hypothetical protein
MIEYLARGETSTFFELYNYNPSYVEHMIGYGLIVGRGNDFEFSFDAIAESVKANFSNLKTSALSERWREIGYRRNRLEEEIRTTLYRWVSTT